MFSFMWHSWRGSRISRVFTAVTHASGFLALLLMALCELANRTYADDPTTRFETLIESGLTSSKLELQDCLQLYGLEGERYNCGYLQVPEDYTSKERDLIKVPFLLIFPEEDVYDATLTPLLITGGGGPGSALLGNRFFSLDDDSFWTYEEFSVADGRLLMILENRGVGHSRPNLDCQYSSNIYQQQYWSNLLEADLSCGSDYVSKDIDIAQYNVHNAVLDMEMFRRLVADRNINVSKMNLYGVSYGTRVAMYYERMFPDTTRAMILDSVSVNEPNSSANELAYAQRSLDMVFSMCRSDARCRETFGADLESEFYKFMNHVEARNIMFDVSWPGSALPVSVPLTATIVLDSLHSALYSSDTFAGIPLTVSQLIDGSYEEFTESLNAYFETYSASYAFYDTAFLTYLCFDTDYSGEIEDSFTQLKLFKFWDFERGREHMSRICSNYGSTSETDLLKYPFTSDVPALFLSGELDPVTPPASALKAAGYYSYHWNIVRDRASHDVISHSACARFLASWFLYHLQEDLESRIEECKPEEAIRFLLQ